MTRQSWPRFSLLIVATIERLSSKSHLTLLTDSSGSDAGRKTSPTVAPSRLRGCLILRHPVSSAASLVYPWHVLRQLFAHRRRQLLTSSSVRAAYPIEFSTFDSLIPPPNSLVGSSFDTFVLCDYRSLRDCNATRGTFFCTRGSLDTAGSRCSDLMNSPAPPFPEPLDECLEAFRFVATQVWRLAGRLSADPFVSRQQQAVPVPSEASRAAAQSVWHRTVRRPVRTVGQELDRQHHRRARHCCPALSRRSVGADPQSERLAADLRRSDRAADPGPRRDECRVNVVRDATVASLGIALQPDDHLQQLRRDAGRTLPGPAAGAGTGKPTDGRSEHHDASRSVPIDRPLAIQP